MKSKFTFLTLGEYSRILTDLWISLICHHGTSKSKKYVFMVQVPSVFQDGAPDHKLEYREIITTFWEGALSKFF